MLERLLLTLVFDVCELPKYFGNIPPSLEMHRCGKFYVLYLLEWYLGLE